MSVCIVTYDLNREVIRPPILGYIKHFYNWARLSESSYAIETSEPTSTVYAGLSQFLDANDQLYVIRLAPEVSGWGSPEVNEWLRRKLVWTPALAA